MGLKTHTPRLRSIAIGRHALAIGSIFALIAGCTQQPTAPPPAPPRAAVPVKPPDWYHQQLAAARVAKRAHRPASDTAGAQHAYDEVMRTACLRAAVTESGKYTARCDAILRPTPTQTLTDPCEANADDPATQTDCSD